MLWAMKRPPALSSRTRLALWSGLGGAMVLLPQPVFPGVLVEARPVAMFQMVDEAGGDLGAADVEHQGGACHQCLWVLSGWRGSPGCS